ncbi:MAG: hypothetical protein NUV61_03640 [Candidatus Azambacteria bacterium]|nr:hypothetical protein [Candidatus Azambacteria bacterium]
MDNFVIASLSVGGHTEAMDFEKTDQWHKLLELTYASWRVADSAIENEFLKNKVKQTATEILVEYPNALGDRKKMEELSSRIRSQRALLSLAQRTSNSRELNFTILKNEYHKINIVVAQLTPSVAPVEHRHQGTPKKEVESVTNTTEVRHQREEERDEVSAAPQKKLEKSTSKVVESVERNEGVRSEFIEPAQAQRAERSEALTEREKKIFQFFSKRKGEKIRLKEIAKVFPDLTDRTVRNDLRALCIKKLVVRSDGHGQASFYMLRGSGVEA